MNQNLWKKVRENIEINKSALQNVLIDGQFEALIKISDSLCDGGVILADEVGLGKTFVALALVENVMAVGGTCGIVVPPGLMPQWEGEIKKFRSLIQSAYNLPTDFQHLKLHRYGDFLGHDHDFPLVQPSKRPLALISHNFSTMLVRADSGAYAYNLPSLYYSRKAFSEDPTGNERLYWTRYTNTYGEDASTAKLCNYLVTENIELTKEESAFLNDEENRILLANDESHKSRHLRIYQSYGRGQIGNLIQRKLMGYGLGQMDLLIIDEAHKSKDSEEDRSILGSLIHEILNPMKKSAPHLRVMGMTATPVELDTAQWFQLLRRIGMNEEGVNSKVKLIEAFSESLEEAKKYPDNRSILNKLITDSQSFEGTLKNHVYRRRRFQSQRLQSYIKNSEKLHTSHPNRRINSVTISFDSLEPAWKRSVLAFEGISKTVKGMKENRLLKLLDKRYASGLLGKEIAPKSTETRGEKVLTPNEVAQVGRINYWLTILNDQKQEESDEDNYLNAHPRVQAGADHIDKLCFSNGEISEEKILVFGTFTKPLRALRSVVNYRYLLRQIDQGLPVRFSDTEENLKHLFEEYVRISAKNDKRLHFIDKLKGNLTQRNFSIVVKEQVNKYNNLSHLMSEFFKSFKDTNQTGLHFIDILPGNDAIKLLPDLDKFYEFLKNYMMSEVLRDKNLYHEFETDSGKRLERITKLAKTVWSNFIIAHSNPEDREDLKSEVGLDKIGDRFDKKFLETIISNDELVKNPNRSPFCRFMDGSTDISVRRTLQLQFNNIEGMPKVLIAQSMVGREGLNLHTACRRVFLFHPEWNPAVVEQQIGRVDRMDSRWEELVKKYLETDGDPKNFPYIEVDFLVFEGTYDQYQFERMRARRENMNAQLFGALLPEESLEKVPEDLKPELVKAAPDFSPLKHRI